MMFMRREKDGAFMNIIQVAEVLRRFGVDVLLLAVGVTFLTSLLKKTVMKSVSSKAYVFLPFALGILIYAAYSLIAKGGICFTAEEVFGILERGFGTGSVATIYYAVYENFLRGKFRTNPLLPLLECIPGEKREQAAEEILGLDRSDEGLCKKIEETLSSYADPPLEEGELAAAAALIEEYLKQIT